MNSVALVRRIFEKCAAKVRRIFFNSVGLLCLKAAQIYEVRLIIISITMNEYKTHPKLKLTSEGRDGTLF